MKGPRYACNGSRPDILTGSDDHLSCLFLPWRLLLWFFFPPQGLQACDLLTVRLFSHFGSRLISSLPHWPRKSSFRQWERHCLYTRQNLQFCSPQKTVEGRLKQWFFSVILRLAQYQEVHQATWKFPKVPFHNVLSENVNFSLVNQQYAWHKSERLRHLHDHQKWQRGRCLYWFDERRWHLPYFFSILSQGYFYLAFMKWRLGFYYAGKCWYFWWW